MALSPRDAFKVGFLARCADAGMTPEAMLQTVKQAQDKLAFLSEVVGGVRDIGKGALTAGAYYGIPASLAIPPIVGGMAGYGLAKATDIDDADVADVKQQEIVNEYTRQADKLLRDRRAKDYRAKRKTSGRRFL